VPVFGEDEQEIFAMVETVSSLVTLSDATAQLVERTAGSIVSVRGGSSAGLTGGALKLQHGTNVIPRS
jgi:hypothetical protein